MDLNILKSKNIDDIYLFEIKNNNNDLNNIQFNFFNVYLNNTQITIEYELNNCSNIFEFLFNKIIKSIFNEFIKKINN